jgi:hypothetical protein
LRFFSETGGGVLCWIGKWTSGVEEMIEVDGVFPVESDIDGCMISVVTIITVRTGILVRTVVIIINKVKILYGCILTLIPVFQLVLSSGSRQSPSSVVNINVFAFVREPNKRAQKLQQVLVLVCYELCTVKFWSLSNVKNCAPVKKHWIS